MATLEVHDRQGRVQRVAVGRDQTILFGASPKCDIVLDDPGALPIHGRLRWKRDRFRIDASPEAGFVRVNGKKMASSSFHQGDELQVGACRIFLINSESESKAKDERPVLQRSPSPQKRPGPPEPQPILDAIIVESDEEEPEAEAEPVPPGRANLEREELFEDLHAPAAEAPVAATVSAPTKVAGPRAGGWGGLIRALREREHPPGEERILSSPLVVALSVALVFLLLMSWSLWGVIQRSIAARLYNQAMESLNEGDYRNAIRRYDEFLANHSSDSRAGKARVLRALANVRQFTSTTGASWTNALEAARAMVRDVRREPSYRDSSTELAELVLKAAEGLADRARGSADARPLKEAESALALHEQVAGKAAEALLERSRVPAKLEQARAAVRKASIRAQALAAMDAALVAGSSAGVYAARDALIGQYGDLAHDRDLVERMKKANDLIRRAVTVETTRRSAETTPQADPLGPPTTLVLRSARAEPGRTPAIPAGPVVHALAEGFAFGLDGTSGTPRWQIPVGLSAPYPPQPVSGGTSALVFDARYDELVRLDARTGAFVWRQEIGEPVSDPPLVLGNQVIQPTPGGKLLLIDLASGELRSTVNLGMTLGRTPASDEAGQFLYVLADRDCLFVLARDPLGCAAVEYLGHAPGSVAAPPARLGRFLVVAENSTVRDSRWRVFLIGEDGTKLDQVQQLTIPGWTWCTPASAGSVIWATGDRGSEAVYAVGGYEEKSPFRLVAETNPEPSASGPAFALARSERELWIGSGRSQRLELDTEHGKLVAGWTRREAGPALAPPQTAGELMILTQQYTEGPGVALWGIEPRRGGAERWRTVLGSEWRVAPAPPESGASEALSTLGEDGRSIELSGERLGAGGFIEVALPKSGVPRFASGPLRRIESDDGAVKVLVPAGPATYYLVRTGTEDFKRVELPAPIGAAPLFWGADLLVPGSDGRVDLLDPLTGAPRAEPYLTVFDRVHPTRWRAPVRLDGGALALVDESGRVRRLARKEGPITRLAASAEVNLGSEVLADPIGTGQALIVVTADGRIRALAARDLSPVGVWPLAAPLATTPATVAGHGFVADVAGNVHAFGPDGQRLWSITLRDGAAAGAPAVTGDSVWFLARGGVLQKHTLADGAPSDRIDLEVVPTADLRAVGRRLVVPVGFGIFRVLKETP